MNHVQAAEQSVCAVCAVSTARDVWVVSAMCVVNVAKRVRVIAQVRT